MDDAMTDRPRSQLRDIIERDARLKGERYEALSRAILNASPMAPASAFERLRVECARDIAEIDAMTMSALFDAEIYAEQIENGDV
jgi:hypothetical protein